VRVIDPYQEPLFRWKRFAANVGMTSLRSPAVHHLDLPSLSLKRFMLSRGELARLGAPPLLPPYGRPALALFNRHADEVVRSRELDSVRLVGEVSALRLVEGGFEVTAEFGARYARRLLLAIGMSDQPAWPRWAKKAREAGASIHHVLDPSFDRERCPHFGTFLVYGGGLSAAQTALAFAAENPGRVLLVMRHRIRVHLFDAEPSWQGQNFMRSFAMEPSPVRRRRIINAARHRGSLTPEVERELARAVEEGRVRLVRLRRSPERVDVEAGVLRMHAEGVQLRAQVVILATGYERRRPGGAWLDRAIEELELPVAPCGYPLVDPSLQWRPGLFVSGPLAELELGPVARNIAGAHRAAARLDWWFERQDSGRVTE